MTDLKNDKNKTVLMYAAAAIALTVLGIVLRTVCMFFFYDAELGYYTADLLPAVFYFVCILSVALFATSFAFVKRDGVKYDGVTAGAATALTSVVCVVSFAIFFIVSVMSFSIYSGNVIFDLICKLSALLGVVYFAMNLVPNVNRGAQTLCGFGIIVWNIYVLAVSYFDITVTLNSSIKIMLHLALVSAMFFFVCEFRCFVSEMRQKAYFFSLCLALFFNGVMAVPALIFNIAEYGAAYEYLLYDLVYLSFFLYFASRMICLIQEKKGKAVDRTDNTEQTV